MEEVEQLTSGPPETLGRGPHPWWLVIVALAAVVGWLLLPDSGVAPRVAPTATSSPLGVARTTPGPDPGYQPGYGGAAPTLFSICTPSTDGRTRLQIRFVLENRTHDALTITDVRPGLPLAGLRALRTRLTPGGCAAAPGRVFSGTLRPGGELLVSFELGLPDRCPQAYPVEALVTSVARGRPRSSTVIRIPVYRDLGSVRFASCVGVE